jgi:hypothetical protein
MSTTPIDEAEVPAIARFAWSGLQTGAQNGLDSTTARRVGWLKWRTWQSGRVADGASALLQSSNFSNFSSPRPW